MKAKIGDYVRIPSGEVYQVKEVITRWKLKTPIDIFGRIDERTIFVLDKGFRGRKIEIADYQCEYFRGMSEAG
jgi:hypothetical protein